MEILKNFGFDPILLSAQVINFLIIFYLLKRFLYKPLLQMLKKRQDEVEKGLLNAEEGRKILEEALEKEKEILRKARTESEKIVNDAGARALKVSEQTLEKTKEQAGQILEDARLAIERERKETEAELERKITKIAIEVLEASMGKVFGKKEQEILTQKALKELKVE